MAFHEIMSKQATMALVIAILILNGVRRIYRQPGYARDRCETRMDKGTKVQGFERDVCKAEVNEESWAY